MDEDSLYDLAVEFRNAILFSVKEGIVTNRLLRNFPRGCCNIASSLLQRYYDDLGIKTYYVSGNDKKGFGSIGHTWLETPEGTVIDITGDQFKYNQEHPFDCPVYVGSKDIYFYKSFPITDEPLDYDRDNELPDNCQIYEVLMNVIKKFPRG